MMTFLQHELDRSIFRNFILILLSLFLSHSLSNAQSPNFVHLTTDEGLPSATIYDIHQDQHGFMWFATERGICRYNGFTFKYFETNLANSSSFSNIQEDSKGNIYFQNFSSQLFKIDNDESILKIDFPEDKYGKFIHFVIDGSDRIWAISKTHCLTKHDKSQWKVKHTINNNVPLAFISNTENEVFILDGRNKILKWNNGKFEEYLALDYTYSMIRQSKNEVFLTQFNTFDIYDVKNDKHLKFNSTEQSNFPGVVDILKDSNGDYWVCNSSGVRLFERQLKEHDDQHFLKGRFITCVFEDSFGNLWFGSKGDGIFMMKNSGILNFTSSNSSIQNDNFMCSATNHKDEIYFGGNNDKIVKINTKSFDITHFAQGVNDVESLLYDSIRNQLYIEGIMLLVYDFTKGHIEDYQIPASNSSKDLKLTSEGLILSAGSSGAKEIDLENPENIKSLISGRCRSIDKNEEDGTIWIGSAEGLFIYYSDSLRQVFSQNQHKIYASTICSNSSERIYVGTVNSGLYVFKDENLEYHFDLHNGLISNNINDIAITGPNVWVATNKGIQSYNTQTGLIKVIDLTDGLVSNEIKDLQVIDHKIWATSNKGVSMFAANQTYFNESPPMVRMGSVKVNDKVHKTIENKTFAYDENSFKFNFSIISYPSGNNVDIYYRIGEHLNTWTKHEGLTNELTFPSLQPGNYHFELKAANEDGILSEVVSIQFTIDEPYWKKWWFFIFILAFLILLTSWYYKRRISRIKRQNQLEKDKRKARLDALTAQLNPHFVFNSLSSIQGLVLEGKNDEADEMIAKFAQLNRQVLEASRNALISIEEEISILKNYLSIEKLCSSVHFNFSIKSEVDSEGYSIAPLFIQPFVENAIKHGFVDQNISNYQIDIKFKSDQNNLIVIIDDNGVGINHSIRSKSQHQSLGTEISKERIEILQSIYNEDITISINDKFETSGKSGTQVKLTLPLQTLY